MIKCTVFGTLFVVVAVAALEYLLFQITVSESIVRGVLAALGYLAGLVFARRAREERGARQPISMRVRVLLSAGVLLFVSYFGLDVTGTGPPGPRAVLGVIALMLLLFGAFEIARKAAQSR
jgi:drug/metabolite transporter (DMT)-like permease